MSNFDSQFLLKQLNWRYSVKRYDPNKKIPAADWHVLEETLRLTASSFGLQPWKFFLIEDVEVRKKLATASFSNQSPVLESSHFLVLTTLKNLDEDYVNRFIKSMSDTRGVPLETLEAYKKNIINTWITGPRKAGLHEWTRRQVYIAMGSMLTAAALMNIDTTPMEGLIAEKYDEILNLQNTHFATVAAIACGYRSPEDPLSKAKKVRFEKKDVIQVI